MPDFLARRTIGGLIPLEAIDHDEFERLPMGKDIRVKCTVARSSPQNRWFHKCLAELFKMQELWPTPTLFRNAVKRALGLFDLYIVNGKEEYEYHSIAFHKMKQSDFNDVCNRFVKFVCEKVLPHFSEREVREILNLLDGDQGKLGQRIA